MLDKPRVVECLLSDKGSHCYGFQAFVVDFKHERALKYEYKYKYALWDENHTIHYMKVAVIWLRKIVI